MISSVVGVIGGSGLYDFPGILNSKDFYPETPFGFPSAPIRIGEVSGVKVAFLARHGIGHTLSPSEINYRANIFALKLAGVERIISISACGSLREDYQPGDIVVPDQLFDFTNLRARSFFGDGLVVHIGTAEPFCLELSKTLFQTVSKVANRAHEGGAMITIEGPRFSTKAESNVFRSWGMSLIGMTTATEAFLSREAEMCYAVMAHVTDYYVWHISEETVSVEKVIKTLHKNTQTAYIAITSLISTLNDANNCSCGSALKDAVITNPSHYPAASIKKLGILLKKYIS